VLAIRWYAFRVGGLGFGCYLAFAGEQKPTTWMPPFVTGTFQITLLHMAL